MLKKNAKMRGENWLAFGEKKGVKLEGKKEGKIQSMVRLEKAQRE